MHLVGTVTHPHKTRICVGFCQESVLRYARGAKDLDRSIDHPRGGRRDDDFSGGDEVARSLIAFTIHFVGCPQSEQPRLLYVAERMRNILTNGAVLVRDLPKADRSVPRRHISSNARCAQPISRMQ